MNRVKEMRTSPKASARVESFYRIGEDAFSTVRVPLFPVSLAKQLFEASDWLALAASLLLDHPEVLDALYIASPSLSGDVRRWLSSPATGLKNPLRLLAYLIRLSSRPTPYGLFATVSRVRFGAETTLSLGEQPCTRSRVDMGWLERLIGKIEADPNLRSRLVVYPNELMLERGDRLFITSSQSSKPSPPFTTNYPPPASIRNTDAVRFLRERSSNGCPVAKLIEECSVAFGLSRDRSDAMITRLWEAGFFITELHAPLTEEPLERVIQVVEKLDTQLHQDLVGMKSMLNAIDALGAWSAYEDATKRMQGVQSSETPAIQVDAVRDSKGGLCKDVLRDVERLAAIFVRCGSKFLLTKYRERFVARYEGEDRLIPLLELANSEVGLGPSDPADTVPAAYESPERDSLLWSKWIDAVRNKAIEVRVDEKDIESILPPMPDAKELPESFELAFQIVARSAADIDRGDYLVAPSSFGTSPMALSSVARFIDMMDDESSKAYRAIRSEIIGGRLSAELVYSPGERIENVAIRPRCGSYEIQIGCRSHAADRIEVRDLLVGIDGGRFFVASKGMNSRLRVSESHLMNTAIVADPVTRTLSQIVHDGRRILRGFDWGALQKLPFLPRITVGRTVASLARWTLPKEMLVDQSSVSSFLSGWRVRWSIPRFVCLKEIDRTLLLDLESQAGQALLVDQGKKTRSPVLLFEEFLPGFDTTWLTIDGQQHAGEFIASVFAHSAPKKSEERQTAFVPSFSDRRGPGSVWFYSKFYCGWSEMDGLITNDILPLTTELIDQRVIDQWFFVRYEDTAPHVRLRMRWSNGSQIQGVLGTLEEWLSKRVVDRIALDTYFRETERYGGAEAIDSVESFFCNDSRDVATELKTAARLGPKERVARCLVGVNGLLTSILGPGAILRWLKYRGRPTERTSPGQWREIKLLRSRIREGHVDPGLLQCASVLTDLSARGTLTRPLDDIVNDLIHMHCNRWGLDRNLESLALRMLWHSYNGLVSANHRTQVVEDA
ncbi:MAG: lantibiotic dehydratase [Candidatus Eremiobacteraeota bacterium]|nr:lantibiotic dehydratase [Candidatus Eremiobacteraeota bacterium]